MKKLEDFSKMCPKTKDMSKRKFQATVKQLFSFKSGKLSAQAKKL